MREALMHFLHMGGYAGFVFTAYGSVVAFLLLQWFLPWRKWKRYLRTQQSTHE